MNVKKIAGGMTENSFGEVAAAGVAGAKDKNFLVRRGQGDGGLRVLGLLGFQEKSGQVVEGRFGHPAFGALPPFAGVDQSGAGQFLEMVGKGRLADLEPPAEFPDAKPGALFHIATMATAAAGQAQEDDEPVGMGKGLEGVGEFICSHSSIHIDISLQCQHRIRGFWRVRRLAWQEGTVARRSTATF
jgi:hypothetical protein